MLVKEECARAIDFFDFYVPTPSKIAKSWEIISFLTNNHPIYWKYQKLALIFLNENAQHRPKVAAAFTFWSRAANLPSINIFVTTIFGPAVSRFLVSNGSTNGTGCLRGLLRLIKTHFENISGTAFWDRDPRYPNRVPWDQKKILKNFLMESY